jgi:hypothetical protein
LQRFGSALNLNPHGHVIVTDGVFIQGKDGEPPEFRATRAPTQAEIADVAWRTCERVVALLRGRGQWLDADPADDALAQEEPLLAACATASSTGTLAMGPRAGQRVMRLFGRAAARDDTRAPRQKNAYGFDVDAAARVPGTDRKRLERLAQYMILPPLSNARITRQPDGRYRVALKRPWRDGTTHIVLTGTEVIEKLVALIPPPRMHLVRYYGVFAPRAKLRPLVVPTPVDLPAPCDHDGSADTEAGKRKRLDWARLLKRVFSIDVLVCPKCQSKMQRIAFITQPDAIRKILDAVDQAGVPP